MKFTNEFLEQFVWDFLEGIALAIIGAFVGFVFGNILDFFLPVDMSGRPMNFWDRQLWYIIGGALGGCLPHGFKDLFGR